MQSAAFDDDEQPEPGLLALAGASVVALVVMALDWLRGRLRGDRAR